MKNTSRFLLAIVVLTVIGCKNRDINEGEAFRPREIHEDMVFHFDKITVDGIEYLILEKDNKNPHEGFGFMAFRANKLMEKQDTLMAYVKALHDLQIRTFAAVTRRDPDVVRGEESLVLEQFIKEERAELELLEQNSMSNADTTLSQTEE
ncbi:MAG: hypothetical protein RJQ14_25205 [Marinoscillum sp.]